MRISRCGELVLAIAVTCIAAGGAQAQRRGASHASPGYEIGTQVFGITHISFLGESITDVSLPGGEVLSLPTIYGVFFVAPQLALEPAVTYEHVSPGGSWNGAALLRLGGYFSGAVQDSPFLFGEVGVLGSGEGGNSTSAAGFGLGGGYRWLVFNQRLAFRAEGRVRRWTSDPHRTELGIVLGAGVILGH